MKKVLYIFTLISTVVLLHSCSSTKNIQKTPQVVEETLSLDVINSIKSNTYSNLDYGVNIDVFDNRDEQYIFSIKSVNNKRIYKYTSIASLDSYTSECVSNTMANMGFNTYVKSNDNYSLKIYINSTQWSSKTNRYAVVLHIDLMNQNGGKIYSSDIKGEGYMSAASNYGKFYTRALKDALEQINWNLIASNLKRVERPAEERYAQVQGNGDTALESTIIRWYIVSAPAGADVQWRVVSSTPDVKNTNQSFLGSTPYESTETFDLIGLTYNNSGNLQIEISCEKAGYVTQRKRFNVRQAIDQKEISTKFNLVKEE